MTGVVVQLAMTGVETHLAMTGVVAQLAMTGVETQLAMTGVETQLAMTGVETQLAMTGVVAHLAITGIRNHPGNYIRLTKPRHEGISGSPALPHVVIASAAKQSFNSIDQHWRLLRRRAPRNDGSGNPPRNDGSGNPPRNDEAAWQSRIDGNSKPLARAPTSATSGYAPAARGSTGSSLRRECPMTPGPSATSRASCPARRRTGRTR